MGNQPIPQSGFVCPNLDDAKRKATQFPTKVDELRERMTEMQKKFVKGKPGVVLAREVIAAALEVLDFLT